jgi:hypothetical protein
LTKGKGFLYRFAEGFYEKSLPRIFPLLQPIIPYLWLRKTV